MMFLKKQIMKLTFIFLALLVAIALAQKSGSANGGSAVAQPYEEEQPEAPKEEKVTYCVFWLKAMVMT